MPKTLHTLSNALFHLTKLFECATINEMEKQNRAILRTELSQQITILIFVMYSLVGMVCFAITGCDDVNMVKPVVPIDGSGEPSEPTEPTEPATNVEVKKPEPSEPTAGPIEPSEPEPPPIQTVVGVVNPEDISGQVFVVNGKDRDEAKTLSGALVTIASGPRAGERFLTDSKGQYVFRAVDGDELHLLTEKDGLEPKEVIVHRSERTTLADGTFFDIDGDPQESPGNILVGYRWDDQVRFIFEETALLPDLLLLLVDELPYAGTYSRQGIITTKHDNACMPLTLAHELAHAHQHFLSFNELGFSSVSAWEDTAEGKAYLKARERDWEEVGKMSYDVGIFLRPYESAAETAKHFWGMQGRLDTKRCSLTTPITKQNAPNRLKWAQEWLSKKY